MVFFREVQRSTMLPLVVPFEYLLKAVAGYEISLQMP